jgi:hypothetical protein
MALTAVVVDPQVVCPKDIKYLVAFAAGVGQGFQFSLKADAQGNVSTNGKLVEIVADGPWFWSFQDNQAVANGTMVPVQPYERLPVQVMPSGVTIYVNVATGTPNFWVVQRL